MEIINYGEILAKEVKEKGYKLEVIADKLDISVNTLKSRFLDGRFTPEQLQTLNKNRYI